MHLDNKTLSKSEENTMKLDEKLKLMIFSSYNSLINRSVTRRLIYIVILILEFAQYLSFVLPASSDEFDSQSVFLSSIVYYVNFTRFLLTDTKYIVGYYAAVGIAALYIVLSLFFFIWHANVQDYYDIGSDSNSGSNSNSSTTNSNANSFSSSSILITYLGKPLSLIAILHRELLFIPSSILLLTIFYCTGVTPDDKPFKVVDQCQDAVHMVYMGLAVFLLIFSLFLALSSSIFYNDTQPDSALPWANCSASIVLLKLLKKIVIVGCSVLSIKFAEMDLIMLILLNIIHCFMVAKLSRHLYMNDVYVYGCLICCEGGLMWQCLVGLVVRVFNVTPAHDIYVLLAIPVAFFLLKSFTNRRQNELVYTSKVEYLPDQSAMEQYVSIMCRVFHGQARCENYIVLQGVFASHIRSCSAPGCPCEDISRTLDAAGGEENLSASTSVMKSVRAISVKQTIQRNLSIHSADIPLTDYNSINKKKFFEFMRSLLERALTTVTKTTRLYIQLAYIHFLYLENKFIALYDLMNAQDSKPSFFEEFLIFRLKNRIEDELKSEEERYARVGNLTLHINQQITFQQNFADFQSKMSKSLEFYIAFWKELMEETPNFVYLNKLGYEIAKDSAKIRNMYLKLSKANPNNIQCKMIYALFLRKIEKDEYEAFEIFEQVNEAKNNQRIRRNYESNKDEKYGANCKAAIILISGNKSNIGEVLNANNELAEILGYDKRDIISTNISKIMPSAIGQKHHELIKEYFHKRGSSKQSSNYDNEKIVFALHKLGHVVPCTLFHKLVPNLVKGIQLIGFIFLADDLAVIRPGEEKVKHEFLAIVLTDTTWAIHGFNSKFARLFHLDLTTVDIRRYLNAEEKLNIGKLIPEIEDNDNLSKMKSDEGLVLDIDVERISKEIEAEIDALHPPAAEEEDKKSEGSSSDRSAIRDFRMQDSISTPTRHKLKTVNVKCVEQNYGKNPISKEHLFSLRVLSFRIHTSILSGFIQVPDPSMANKHGGRLDEREVFSKLLDERQSQSQTSSHCSVMKYHGKAIKDFKAKMHTMKEPVVLKWLYRLGFLIFFVLFGLSLTQLLLAKNEISSNRSSMATIRNAYTRVNTILSICLSTRSLFEIYKAYEPAKSDLIPDRITYYKARVESQLEALREVHNTILKASHSYSSAHTDLVSNPANLAIWDMADSGSTGLAYTSSNISFNVGVTNFIARATDISGISDYVFGNGSQSGSLDYSMKNKIERLEYYVIYNGKNTLREIAETSAGYFASESVDDFESSKALLYVFSCLGTGCVVLIVVFFVPYIMKVQKNILKVFDHVSDIKHDEIRKILDMCYIFKDEIEAPIAKLKAIYDKEDFSMTTDEIRKDQKIQKEIDEKRKQKAKVLKKLTQKNQNDVTRDGEQEDDDEEKKSQKAPLNPKKEKGKEEGKEKEEESKDKDKEENNMSSQDREKQYLILTEERRTKAKKKLFSQITSSKRKGYIFRLAVFLIFFAIFLIVDILLLKSFYEQSVSAFDLVRLFSTRDYVLKTAVLFYREDLVSQTKLKSQKRGDILQYYVDQSFNTEKETLTESGHISSSFSSMKDYVNLLESSGSCDTFASSDSNLCKTVFSGFLSHGISMAILRILRKIQNTDIMLALVANNATAWQVERAGSEVVEINDVMEYYMDHALGSAVSKFMSVYDSYLDNVSMSYNIKFSIFVVFLVMISLIVWMNILNNLNTDILRAKGVFNILPTYLLSENTEFIKDISKGSIFTQR